MKSVTKKCPGLFTGDETFSIFVKKVFNLTLHDKSIFMQIKEFFLGHGTPFINALESRTNNPIHINQIVDNKQIKYSPEDNGFTQYGYYYEFIVKILLNLHHHIMGWDFCSSGTICFSEEVAFLACTPDFLITIRNNPKNENLKKKSFRFYLYSHNRWTR